jgi:hypothetical protein
VIPSTILFDLDDTLIPEEVGLDVAFRSTVEPLGLSESAALDMVATVRATARWLLRFCDGRSWPALTDPGCMRGASY